jgi:hypothetical protein
MGRKISFDAEDRKKGMSLKELLDTLNNAAGLAKTNEKALEDCKVIGFVNFGGTLKQIVVEV